MSWPIVEIEDTTDRFRWRLKLGDEASEWCGFYQGILVHVFADGRKFGVVTSYFDPSLPELEAFQIVER